MIQTNDIQETDQVTDGKDTTCLIIDNTLKIVVKHLWNKLYQFSIAPSKNTERNYLTIFSARPVLP